MRLFTFIICVLALGSLVGCGGGSDSSELSPSVLRKRVGIQLTLGEGSKTPQGKTLTGLLPSSSLVSCWNEGADRVCGAAVPKFPSGGLTYSRSFHYWTFYRAVFHPGSEDPDIEQVEPEGTLAPSRRAA